MTKFLDVLRFMLKSGLGVTKEILELIVVILESVEDGKITIQEMDTIIDESKDIFEVLATIKKQKGEDNETE